MCLIAFAIQASSRWPLVIAANRDEFFARAALPLASWHTPSGSTILSGRDLRGGGTWLGCTPQGRVAMLTNVRQADNTVRPRSRGDLVTWWLDGNIGAEDFMDAINGADYGGFNLVMGDMTSGVWSWLSNRSFTDAGQAFDQGLMRQKTLEPGIYGLSNAELDTPWPKTVALTGALRVALANNDIDSLTGELQRALENPQLAPPDKLPKTGVSPELESLLSSALVRDPARSYGTRCSTVLVASQAFTCDQASEEPETADAARQDGYTVRIEEITRSPDGPTGKVVLDSRWPSARRQPDETCARTSAVRAIT